MMNQSIPLRTYVASAILCLTLFASCSADDDADTVLPEGKYPMTFATAMEGLTQTRATTDNAWTGGEKIVVQVGGEVKEYTAAADGRLSADDPFYWSNSSETKTVTAWYCGDGSTAAGMINAGQLPASWTVQTDQAGNAGYAKSDFLYASTEVSFTERETKPLPFYHQTARVVINIKNAEAATDASEIVSVVIGNADNLALSGKYTAPTAGGTVGTWDTSSGSSPQMGTIIPKEIPATDSYLKSYAALVIPQNMSGQKFIAVELTSGKTYYYTPTNATDADLQSGKQHTYNITVKHGYLEVNASSSGTWTGGGSEGVKSIVKGFSATDLKIGDYYYSDGTTSDGGYRKYGDGTTAHLDIYPDLTNGREVIGIVYSTDVSRIGEAAKDALNKNDISTPRGLVMALTDASDDCRWGNEGTDENSSGDVGTPFRDNISTLQKQYNNVDGYGETHWILNTYKSDGTTLKDTYTAFYHASRYGTADSGTSQYAAPAHTTGWFIPSMGQWWDILSNLGGIDLTTYRESGNSYTSIPDATQKAVNNMNKYLGKISNATEFSTNTYFWSSSEYSSDGACYVFFRSNGYLYLNSTLKSYSSNKVRCVFAF